MPAAPAIVDTDNDGFVDTAYLGDIGGHMWRFKFCKKADGDSCTTSNWTGSRFFRGNRFIGHPTDLYDGGRGQGPRRKPLGLLGHGR